VGGEPLEDSSRRHPIPVIDALERQRDRRFNRALSRCVHPGPALRETQHSASSIAGGVGTSQQSLRYKAPKHAGERAGMYVQHGRQIASRYAREQADHAQDQPLWTRYADVACHSLRYSFQSVNDRPEELHELQHVREIGPLPSAVNGSVRVRHINLSSN
jgi:hypothetical protein